ncbi:putative F420-0 ABC transporter permease subunit [Timonella sp. A28]|uniref:putative F420-0 ABC transporter permease subunit n=1 Tax=Timonella sp. A28 TaxID=3442640 RepID=UPI003EC095EE
MRKLSRFAVLLLLGLCLIGSVAVAVTFGPAHISPYQVWVSFAQHVGVASLFDMDPLPPLRDAVVWQLRFPRVLVAACVGAGLAVCGVVMQTLTRNPLADPYVLGLSSGASLGAVSVIVLNVSVFLPFAAFFGAVAALVGVLFLAGLLGQLTPTRMVLAGLAVSQLAAAATSFIIFWSADGDSYREVLSWLMGSLGSTTWHNVLIAGIAVILFGVPLCFTGNVLDAFTFGDDSAHALGVHPVRWRWLLLIAVALLTGALVSVSGAIGFVGLIIPHVVRMVTGTSHRFLLPVSACVGAIFLIWADVLARTIFEPREIPVGIVTALIGAPLFGVILWKTRGAHS